jgi:alpha-mannosidase
VVKRGNLGEVPGGRWVRIGGKVGFASDALYGFETTPGLFQVAIVRASRYANSTKTAPHEELWRPAVDAGELQFRFLFTTDLARLPRLARELEEPVLTQCVSPHAGRLGRSGSLFQLDAAQVQLIALKPAEKGRGFIVRLQEISGRSAQVEGRWLGKKIRFGKVEPWSLNTFRIVPKKGGFAAQPTNIIEI